MRKKTNSPWRSSVGYGPVPSQVATAFEKEVERLKLMPDQLIASQELRYWISRHCGNCYVPEALLEAMGIFPDIRIYSETKCNSRKIKT